MEADLLGFLWFSGLWWPPLPLLAGIVLLLTGSREWGGSLLALGVLGTAGQIYYMMRKLERTQVGPAFDAQVVVHLPLSSEFGTEAERTAYQRLAGSLEQRVSAQNAGVYDGDGVGEASFDLYFMGDDEERLVRILRAGVKAEGVKARIEVMD